MARLNEAAAPASAVGESVESLKRRFIRQNREIARTNSAQSLRIRTLEAETSRLLSENITIREENIQLKHEIEKGQSLYALRQVSGVRGKLEHKLAELNSLVAELKVSETSKPPSLPKNISRRTSRKSTSSSANLRRSPNMRDIRNPFEFTEADAAEGRLPPIQEDKCFPRKTLDSEEIRAIFPQSDDAVDSPELGPPPIAHFEDGDPIKHDIVGSSSPLPASSRPASDEAEDTDPTAKFFANLETRRKRRESASKKPHEQNDAGERQELDPIPQSMPEPVKQDPAKRVLKTGAKRKFGVREDDERPNESKDHQENDFFFNRRNNNAVKGAIDTKATSSRKESKEGTKATSRTEKSRTPATQTNRRALGEKPVNTDPIASPTKARATPGGKPISSKDKDKEKERKTFSKISHARSSSKDNLLAIKSISLPKSAPEPKIATIEPNDLPPITPAPQGLDLFSPESSNPPTAGNETRDTPPPSDISERMSRRRGAGVSYAEPNLRDKMRRPGKELTDAVTDARHARSSSQRSDSSLREGEGRANLLSVKKEEGSVPSTWKSTVERGEPTSPLGSKSESADGQKAAPVLDTRRRRVSGAYVDGEQGHGGTSATIAALVAGSHKRLSRARENTSDSQEAGDQSNTQGASIFDFRPSSPEDSSAEKQLKVSKRHSSVPDLAKDTKLKKTAIEETRSIKSTAGARNQRRRDTMAMDASAEFDIPAGVSIDEQGGGGSMRAARAERRRSMMV